MKHPRPTSAIAQSRLGERIVNGATRNAASGGQMRLCPNESSEPGGGKGSSSRAGASPPGRARMEVDSQGAVRLRDREHSNRYADGQDAEEHHGQDTAERGHLLDLGKFGSRREACERAVASQSVEGLAERRVAAKRCRSAFVRHVIRRSGSLAGASPGGCRSPSSRRGVRLAGEAREVDTSHMVQADPAPLHRSANRGLGQPCMGRFGQSSRTGGAWRW